MTAVRLEAISKQFDTTLALSGINLRIEAGELFFLLGPSGCGKSTLLRLIAGLHEPTGGRIYFNDRDVTALGTEKRNAVMCFQSYALWPHMTVRENIRFGLSVRNLPKPEQNQRLDEVLRLVQMQKLGERRPSQLSGGQQQRVALARALAVRPDCLLLDEPLSNLDATLRLEMRSEIRRICKASHFTTVYVTHDQKEALSVADRIAVMEAGQIVQVGTPDEIYRRPRNAFVAAFIGQTNLMDGTLTRDGSGAQVQTPLGLLRTQLTGDAPTRNTVRVSIRPEAMRIMPSANEGRPGMNRFAGRGLETMFLGESSEHVIEVNGQRLKILCSPPARVSDAEVAIEVDPADVVVLPE